MSYVKGQGHRTGFSDFSPLRDRTKSLWTR